MKKIVAVLLFFVPTITFAVPTVRNFGNAVNAKASAEALGQQNMKVVPARVAATPQLKPSANTSARIGTLKAPSTKKANTVGSSSSRFPIISSGKSYGVVSTPQPNKTNNAVAADIDVDAISTAVIKKIDDQDLYVGTENFEDKVRRVENPKFDTVKIVNSGEQIDTSENIDGRVYMWIEVKDDSED